MKGVAATPFWEAFAYGCGTPKEQKCLAPSEESLFLRARIGRLSRHLPFVPAPAICAWHQLVHRAVTIVRGKDLSAMALPKWHRLLICAWHRLTPVVSIDFSYSQE